MRTTEEKLINEIEQLIKHAEDDTLDYSVLEHARKVVFQFRAALIAESEIRKVVPNPSTVIELSKTDKLI